MICLFFDTSSDILKVTLVKDSSVIYDENISSKNDHSSYLDPCINNAIKSNNLEFNDVDKIIVGIGPGSFTGTRIAISVAKTYAYSLNIPVFGISSLEEMIYSIDNYDYYVPVIEEKNDNLYFSIFDKDKKRVIDDLYGTISDLYNILSSYKGKVAVISNSNKKYDSYDSYQKDINVIELIKSINLNNKEVNPHLLKPNYIKKIEVESKL